MYAWLWIHLMIDPLPKSTYPFPPRLASLERPSLAAHSKAVMPARSVACRETSVLRSWETQDRSTKMMTFLTFLIFILFSNKLSMMCQVGGEFWPLHWGVWGCLRMILTGQLLSHTLTRNEWHSCNMLQHLGLFQMDNLAISPPLGLSWVTNLKGNGIPRWLDVGEANAARSLAVNSTMTGYPRNHRGHWAVPGLCSRRSFTTSRLSREMILV